MRHYAASVLMPDGDCAEIAGAAPAHPTFEAAFAGLTGGALLVGEAGPLAVEDLRPGTKVMTRDAGFQPVIWLGAVILPAETGSSVGLSTGPSTAVEGGQARLFRIKRGGFGPDAPMRDLTLARHARLLHRADRIRAVFGYDAATTPIHAFEDGERVTRVDPAKPVTLYHLAFAKPQIVKVNGLELECYHPGPGLESQLSAKRLKQFMGFFPHLKAPADFGRMLAPRLSAAQYRRLVGG